MCWCTLKIPRQSVLKRRRHTHGLYKSEDWLGCLTQPCPSFVPGGRRSNVPMGTMSHRVKRAEYKTFRTIRFKHKASELTAKTINFWSLVTVRSKRRDSQAAASMSLPMSYVPVRKSTPRSVTPQVEASRSDESLHCLSVNDWLHVSSSLISQRWKMCHLRTGRRGGGGGGAEKVGFRLLFILLTESESNNCFLSTDADADL